MKYDTYIFDLDGTLLDTLEDLAASTNHAMRWAGLPEHSQDEVRRFVGNGVRMLIQRAVPGGEAHPRFEEILGEFRRHYLAHSLDHTKPYPGIMDMLEKLQSAHCHVAVVSNKFYDATRELCHHFFGDLVPVAIGERESDPVAPIRKKPFPDSVFEAIRQLGVPREQAVYVGDSDVDIATARNAGLPCISVLWGFRSREFLMEHGASMFVSTPDELLSQGLLH